MVKNFLSKIKIKNILPCVTDARKIRVIAETERNIREVLPYLNAILEGAIYIQETNTLTFTKDEMLITLYPQEVRIAKVKDEESALNTLSWLQKIINETWAKREEIKPVFERKNELKPLDIYRYLPQINCGKCGEGNCLALAIKIIQREKTIMSCSPLFTPELSSKRNALLNLLRETGYPTPDTF